MLKNNLVITMKRQRNKILVVCFAALLIRTAAVQAENWPGFRGPTGQGISTEKKLPVRWSDKENIAWKTPIAGQGGRRPSCTVITYL